METPMWISDTESPQLKELYLAYEQTGNLDPIIEALELISSNGELTGPFSIILDNLLLGSHPFDIGGLVK